MFVASHRALGLDRAVVALAILFSSLTSGLEEAWSQCEVEVGQVLASDGASSDQVGYSVSVSDQVAVVGARGDDDNGSGSGSAYVLTETTSGWIEEQKLLAGDGAPDDQFGNSVAVSGEVIIVGAFGHGEAGAAYMFRFDPGAGGWVEEQKLLAADGTAGDNFGYSVAVSGNVALIGAYGVDDNGVSSGSAYIFRFDGTRWVEERKLLASDGAPYDFFGVSVALSDGVAVVGAYLTDEGEMNSGSAYVYRFNGSTWMEEQKLVASDGAADDRFGGSVAVSGDVVVVGAVQDDDYGTDSGSAYVYRVNGSVWIEEVKLLPTDGAARDKFGVSVAVSGNLVAIGAYMDDENDISDSGSVYGFRFDGLTWVQTEKLVASDAWYADYLGFCVGVSGDATVAGAIQDDNKGNNSGSVYVFERRCAPQGCLTDDECTDGDPCTADVCADGACVHARPPDFDGSGGVDLIDFAWLRFCMAAPPGGTTEAQCQCANLNDDGPIDLRDYAVFQFLFTGAR